MSKDEHQRQKNVKKKLLAKKSRDARAKQREKHKQQQAQSRQKHAFGTTAYCWPIRYRELFFDVIPRISSDNLDFSGTDLHLKWFTSQEDRRLNRNGEVVSALKINSCVQIDGAGKGKNQIMRLECSGSLSQQVGKDSTYGQWYRKQWQERPRELGDDEYQDVPVEFILTARKFTEADAARANALAQKIESIPIVPKSWNITHIDIPESARMESNALETERLYDLLFMLRIWTPFFTSENLIPKLTKEKLEEQLTAIEETELKFGEVLFGYSTESERLNSEAILRYQQISELEKELEAKKALYDQKKAAFDASFDNEKEQNRKRKEMTIARDAWLSAKDEFDRKSSKLNAEAESLSQRFVSHMVKEFSAADDFSIQFMFRQHILALLAQFPQ